MNYFKKLSELIDSPIAVSYFKEIYLLKFSCTKYSNYFETGAILELLIQNAIDHINSVETTFDVSEKWKDVKLD